LAKEFPKESRKSLVIMLHGLLVRIAMGKSPSKVIATAKLTALECFNGAVLDVATSFRAIDAHQDDGAMVRDLITMGGAYSVHERNSAIDLRMSYSATVRRTIVAEEAHHAHDIIHAQIPNSRVVSIDLLEIKRLAPLVAATLEAIFPHSTHALFVVIAPINGQMTLVR
jgi:hypothetical protein